MTHPVVRLRPGILPWAVGAVVVVVMLSSGCVDPERMIERDAVDLDHAVAAGGRVSVTSENGDIQVRSYAGNLVEVHAVKESWGGVRQFDLVEVVFAGNEHDLRVEVVFEPEAHDVSVDLTVRVPRTAEVVSVSTVNGNIDVIDTRGNVTINTLNGWVTADGVEGFAEISTLNGRVEVIDTAGIGNVSASNGGMRMDVRAIAGDVELRSLNGAISVSVSRAVDADVVITVTNGLIQFHDTILDATLVEAKRVEGTVGAGGPELTLTVTNGEVYFYELL
jgi:hypothetical protein